MDAYPTRIFLVVGLGLFAVPAFAEDKLPNLVAVDAERLCLDDNGNTLRFDTTSWNDGDGPLEIRAAKPDRKARTKGLSANL